MKCSFLSLLAATGILLLCTSAKPRINQSYQYNYENVLGTSFELKVIASSEEAADRAEQNALDEIDRLNNILSTYSSTSEISRWLRTYQTKERISPELSEVLFLFDKWKDKTHGALNASAVIASNLWKKASADQKLPGREELSKAVAAMREPQWYLNKESHTAVHLSHQPLVLNSFVKGYIINKVSAKVMGIPGIRGSVINIGGDIVVAGDRHENILIADPLADAENNKPLAVLNLQNRAIATSGNYRRGFQIGNQWFSHILDVRTALPVSEVISATVVAGDATDAGALATAFNILSPKESEALSENLSGVEYQIITKSGEEITSKGWSDLAIRTQLIDEKSESPYEVSINLELAQFQGRFRRPFVAVWVENKKKESVRTMALWFNKPRWLPDLQRWFSKNQSLTHDYSRLSTISSATRYAGKYTLVWDGKDDEGNAVPSGKYTLYIEAAREHGTYQLIKQEIDMNGKPEHFELDGGVEITSASLDLHLSADK